MAIDPSQKKNLLTVSDVANSPLSDKPYRLYDGRNKGLYLYINKTSKAWRYQYRDGSTKSRKTITIGKYPKIGLIEARQQYLKLKGVLLQSTSNAEKIYQALAPDDTFELLAKQWLDNRQSSWTERTYKLNASRIDNHLSELKHRAAYSITAKECYDLLTSIQDKGRLDIAHRVKSIISQILRYGIVRGKVERDVTIDISRTLKPSSGRHWAYIDDPKQLSKLLKRTNIYKSRSLALFIQIIARLFVRPGELRNAKRDQFDFNAKLWRIPAQQMKMKRQHIVPLSAQVINLLKEVFALSPPEVPLLFPSPYNSTKPISDNTPSKVLRSIGYSREQMTVHGFRATASTLLHEMGYESIIIERQLAHVDNNRIRAAYNHAEFLKQRTKMMHDWSDYLDRL